MSHSHGSAFCMMPHNARSVGLWPIFRLFKLEAFSLRFFTCKLLLIWETKVERRQSFFALLQECIMRPLDHLLVLTECTVNFIFRYKFKICIYFVFWCFKVSTWILILSASIQKITLALFPLGACFCISLVVLSCRSVFLKTVHSKENWTE